MSAVVVRQRRRALRRRAPARARATPSPARTARRPCVVLAHGFAGTVDSGLLPYAERFAAAGLDALAFDYRHFGASDGEPRQLLSIPRQLEDYAAAIAFARSLEGVDPERDRRVGLLLLRRPRRAGRGRRRARRGRHLAGAGDGRPGDAAERSRATRAPAQLARLVLAGLRDLAGSLRGRPPVMVPVVGPPGQRRQR